MIDRDEQKLFENEVRNIARQLWPEAQYSGAKVVDGLERDGVFETEDCIHLLEATVSRRKDKAIQDSKKLALLAKKLQVSSPRMAVKCWFVTRDEPTADQRDAIAKHCNSVNALSFSQFQSKLIDVSTCLNLRENYPFGSVRDPATGAPQTTIEYVPLDLVELGTRNPWSISEIRDGLLSGRGYVVLGDYGAGKSMTLREVYKGLRKAYFNQHTSKFPIYLNLRDHFGQTNPAEVLERHARNLGFSHPAHLVRAWRAGYVILLLDGFDELTTAGIQGLWKRLQDTRYRAMQAVRDFVRHQPKAAGLILTGRAHFFDAEKERRTALGVSPNFVELTLNEFSDEQIQRYLEKQGLKGAVPSWMPSRPLLVGYLAASGMLQESIVNKNSGTGDGAATDPARGWDLMLDRVCAREAEIEAGIDGPTVRRILERLATKARGSQSGLGPLSHDQIVASFSEICGYQPDEKGLVLLQRLPGLGIDRVDEGTRLFLDEELADACRAGDISHFVADPFNMSTHIFRSVECGLEQVGIGLCVLNAQAAGLSVGKMNAALRKAADSEDMSFVALDLAQITIELGYDIEVPIQLQDIYIPSLELFQGISDCSNLQFRTCFFTRISIDPEATEKFYPKFVGCYIDELEGRSSRKDLPGGVFDVNCQIERFSEAPETTNAITGMDLPLGAIVLLTVLKKVYLQGGSGRKENALSRGLDHHGRRLVPSILRLLQSEGLIAPYRRGGIDMTIWVPDRARAARVAKIVTSPRTCGDPLIVKAANLV